MLADLDVIVWTYGRDQARDVRSIGASLKERLRESSAVVVLVSQFTLASGASQWVELAYADAFGLPTFILLHHVTFQQLKKAGKAVPSLVVEGQCTPAVDWQSLHNGLRRYCEKHARLERGAQQHEQ